MPFHKKTLNPKLETLNLELKLKGQKPGYTLIEFLVVIGILSLSVGSILLLLTTTIKGANQANITAEVKQNGQNALDSLSSQIRSAKTVSKSEILAFLGATSGIFLTFPNDNPLTIVCINSTASTNGWIGVFRGNSLNETPPSASSLTAVTNTDPKTGVDIQCTSSSFQVSQGGSSVATVSINFTAVQGVSAPSRVDFKATSTFQTTVVLRLYN